MKLMDPPAYVERFENENSDRFYPFSSLLAPVIFTSARKSPFPLKLLFCSRSAAPLKGGSTPRLDYSIYKTWHASRFTILHD
jgi:hypothetical protein